MPRPSSPYRNCRGITPKNYIVYKPEEALKFKGKKGKGYYAYYKYAN